MVLIQELVQKLGAGADACADAIIGAAAKRAGKVSRAGRESSLSADADSLLAAAVDCLSEPKEACHDYTQNHVEISRTFLDEDKHCYVDCSHCNKLERWVMTVLCTGGCSAAYQSGQQEPIHPRQDGSSPEQLHDKEFFPISKTW